MPPRRLRIKRSRVRVTPGAPRKLLVLSIFLLLLLSSRIVPMPVVGTVCVLTPFWAPSPSRLFRLRLRGDLGSRQRRTRTARFLSGSRPLFSRPLPLRSRRPDRQMRAARLSMCLPEHARSGTVLPFGRPRRFERRLPIFVFGSLFGRSPLHFAYTHRQECGAAPIRP